MTKEERAEKWCQNIPQAQGVDLSTKIAICNKVANRLVAVFLIVVLAEFVAMALIGDGMAIHWMTDTINMLTSGHTTYRAIALLGGIVVLPVLIIPIGLFFFLKRRFLAAEFRKLS